MSRAAVSFGNPKPMVSSFGNATAHFIGNDWQRSTRGDDYQTLLGGPDSELVKKLDEISRYYAFFLAKRADTNGWAAKDE
ncbi:hypothetical protein [Rhizobium laguerreae]|uniref:hypothetical protein n=1 Tax=Rhizobium laguerreae TaxID=1076926 RepID=UPI001FEDE999|nr:hypothetical protein [Rhizobium laguerreae]